MIKGKVVELPYWTVLCSKIYNKNISFVKIKFILKAIKEIVINTTLIYSIVMFSIESYKSTNRTQQNSIWGGNNYHCYE